MNYSTTDEAIRQAHNKQLSFFFDTMPRKVGVGNTRHIEDIIKRPSLEDAVKYPFIQHNFPQRHFITFETTKNPMFEIIVQDLPCPTMIVGDSVFHDADVSYQFLEPIPQKPSRKTRELLRDVRTAYRTMLRARRVIGVHTPIRNPSWEKDGSPGYEVIATGKPVTLTELAESIPATFERRPLYQVHDTSAFEATSDADSRNCSLFEAARR